MLIPGLVSITFRKLSPRQVLDVAVAAHLRSIEWGGDVHVPHGDFETARDVRRMCADANVTIAAYGSYYRAGVGEKLPSTKDVMLTAAELGAARFRVWAGSVASADADKEFRSDVAKDLVNLCDRAADIGLQVALEYHSGTLTDTPESTVALIEAVGRPNLLTYWQPRHGLPIEENLADIAMLRPWLGDVHAFHWWPTAAERHPLIDGADRWAKYLEALQEDHKQRHVMLEFSKNDDVEQLKSDARTLTELLAQVRR